MIPAHCSADIAPVPESVSRSMRTSCARKPKRLKPTSRSAPSRCARVVKRMGSTLLIRNGSMIVLNSDGIRTSLARGIVVRARPVAPALLHELRRELLRHAVGDLGRKVVHVQDRAQQSV